MSDRNIRKPLPKDLGREHILKAMALLDQEGFQQRNRPTKFAVLHQGKVYPPKLLISKSCLFLTGEEFPVAYFNGGDAGCNPILRSLGFKVVDMRSMVTTEINRYELFDRFKRQIEQSGPILLLPGLFIPKPSQLELPTEPGSPEFYYTLDATLIGNDIPEVPVLLSASNVFNSYGRLKDINLPGYLQTRAADSGGFAAGMHWNGEFPFSIGQYIDWLGEWFPNWAAMLDLFCRPDRVAEYQARTTVMAWDLWKHHYAVPWSWVPTVQGASLHDYISHARTLKPLIEEMQDFYTADPSWRVGIGSLVGRSPAEVRRIVRAVIHEIGDVPLHLWGMKLKFLRSPVAIPETVVSMDSAAWNLRTGSNPRKRYYEPNRGNMTQRQWTYNWALPFYRGQLEEAIARPKQVPLLE